MVTARHGEVTRVQVRRESERTVWVYLVDGESVGEQVFEGRCADLAEPRCVPQGSDTLPPGFPAF